MTTERVSDVFMSILDDDVLEDRREYQPKDHSKMYGLDKTESEELFRLVQQEFDPTTKVPNKILDVRPEVLRDYFEAWLYDCRDGWSNQEQLTILQLFRDIQIAYEVTDKDYPPIVVRGMVNRDMYTTTLTISTSHKVDVNPIDLFKNMLENVGPLGKDLLERVTDWSSTD